MEHTLHYTAEVVSLFLEAVTIALLCVGAILVIRNLVAATVQGLPAEIVALKVWRGMAMWLMVELESPDVLDLGQLL